MIRIIYYEGRKLFHRKVAWFVIFGLILANGLVTYYNIYRINEEGYCIKDVSSVYEELDNKSNQEQHMWIQTQIELYYQGIQEGEQLFSYGTERVFHLILEQIKIISQYDDYLAEMDFQAEKMMKSSVFTEPNTFAYRNLLQTPKAYEHLKGVEVVSDFSYGVLILTDHQITDAFLLLSLIIFVMHLLISEREEGTLPLIKATKNGYGITIAAKAILLLLLTILFVLIFYGFNLVVSAKEVGLGDLSRPIQSLEGYISSPFKFTVLEYIVLFFIGKVLGIFAVISVFFLMCILCRNNVLSSLIAIFIFGIEAIFCTTIDMHSWLSPLSQFNLIALLDTSHYFSNYVNINLFSYPVNIVISGIITALIAIILGNSIGMYIYVTETSSQERRNWIGEKMKAKRRVLFFTGHYFSLLKHESYKLLIMNKGLLILLIFLGIQFFYFGDLVYIIDQEELYYQQYSTILSGKLSHDKEVFIQQEQNQFEEVEKEKERLMKSYEKGDIDDSYFDYLLAGLEINGYEERGFKRAQNQYQILNTIEREKYPVEYEYQTGWNSLFAQEARQLDLIDYGKAFIVLILGISSFGSIEKMTNMDSIIAISNRGRKAVIGWKVFICICLAIVSAMISFLPRIIVIFQTYGIKGLQAPVRSIIEISWAFNDLSILSFFILYQVKRLFIVGLASIFILTVSYRSGNTITTMLISTAVLLLPIMILLLT